MNIGGTRNKLDTTSKDRILDALSSRAHSHAVVSALCRLLSQLLRNAGSFVSDLGLVLLESLSRYIFLCRVQDLDAPIETVLSILNTECNGVTLIGVSNTMFELLAGAMNTRTPLPPATDKTLCEIISLITKSKPNLSSSSSITSICWHLRNTLCRREARSVLSVHLCAHLIRLLVSLLPNDTSLLVDVPHIVSFQIGRDGSEAAISELLIECLSHTSTRLLHPSIILKDSLPFELAEQLRSDILGVGVGLQQENRVGFINGGVASSSVKRLKPDDNMKVSPVVWLAHEQVWNALQTVFKAATRRPLITDEANWDRLLSSCLCATRIVSNVFRKQLRSSEPQALELVQTLCGELIVCLQHQSHSFERADGKFSKLIAVLRTLMPPLVKWEGVCAARSDLPNPELESMSHHCNTFIERAFSAPFVSGPSPLRSGSKKLALQASDRIACLELISRLRYDTDDTLVAKMEECVMNGDEGVRAAAIRLLPITLMKCRSSYDKVVASAKRALSLYQSLMKGPADTVPDSIIVELPVAYSNLLCIISSPTISSWPHENRSHVMPSLLGMCLHCRLPQTDRAYQRRQLQRKQQQQQQQQEQQNELVQGAIDVDYDSDSDLDDDREEGGGSEASYGRHRGPLRSLWLSNVPEGVVASANANQVDFSLVEPVLHLFDENRSPKVRKAAATAFLRLIRHVKRTSLHSVRQNLRLAILNLLFDDDSKVRQVTANHADLLVVRRGGLSDAACLFNEETEQPDLLFFEEHAVAELIKQINVWIKERSSANLILMDILTSVGNLSKEAVKHARGMLMWILVEQLVHITPEIRSAAFSRLRELSFTLSTHLPVLVLAHRQYLYPRILRRAVVAPKLVDHFSSSVMRYPKSHFLASALPMVVPSLIEEKDIVSLERIASLWMDATKKELRNDAVSKRTQLTQSSSLSPAKILVNDQLAHILAHMIAGIDAHSFPSVNQFLVSTFCDGKSFPELIKSCLGNLLYNLVWQLGDEDLGSREAATVGMWLCMSSQSDSFASGRSGDERCMEILSQGLLEVMGRPEDMALFLDKFVLRIFTQLIATLTDDADKKRKAQSLRSFQSFLTFIGPRLQYFVPKIIAMLKNLVSVATMPDAVCGVWDVFIRLLPINHLGPILSEVVVALLPYLERGVCPERVEALMTYLIVDHREELREYFAFVPLLLDISGVPQVRAVLLEEEAGRPFVSKLEGFSSLLSHESPDIRQRACSRLLSTLRMSRLEIEDLTFEGRSGEIASLLVTTLLERCTDSSFQVRLLAAQCVGELGAIDPGQINTQMLDENVQSRVADDDTLARRIITQNLVRALKGAPDSKTQDRALLTIQELLRICHCNGETPVLYDRYLLNKSLPLTTEEERGVANWANFAPEVRDLIQPCLTSQYNMGRSKRRRARSNAGFGGAAGDSSTSGGASSSRKLLGNPSTTSGAAGGTGAAGGVDMVLDCEEYVPMYHPGVHFNQWIANWSLYMIDNFESPRSPLFRACIGVIKSDIQTVMDLLPYILESNLKLGDPVVHACILTEIRTVLETAAGDEHMAQLLQNNQQGQGGSSNGVSAGGGAGSGGGSSISDEQLCVQALFEAIDILWMWLHNQESSREQESRPGQSASSEDLLNLRNALSRIPNGLLARAAFECAAYTRSLRYYEMKLREDVAARQSLEEKNNHSPPSLVGDLKSRDTFSFCRDLDPADIEFLQRIYASTEEPDGMTGIAALRKRTTLHEQIVDYEVAGNWVDSLTCYEQAMQVEPDYVQNHDGLISCLMNLGHLQTAVTHVHGTLSMLPNASPRLAAQGVRAAWRLCNWQLLNDFLQYDPEDSFEVYLGRILLSMQQRDGETYNNLISACRSSIVYAMSAASRDSYRRSYTHLLHLHMLQEVEQMQEFLAARSEAVSDADDMLRTSGRGGGAARSSKMGRNSMMVDSFELMDSSLPHVGLHHWESRLSKTESLFHVREPILSLRRVLFQMHGMGQEMGDMWLQYAREARIAGQVDTAAGALLHAARLGTPTSVIERAKLFHDRGKIHEALMILEEASAEMPTSLDSSPPSSSPNADSNVLAAPMGGANGVDSVFANRLKATRHFLLGKWTEEAATTNSEYVMGHFSKSLRAEPKWDKAFFYLGKKLEERYQAHLSVLLQDPARIEEELPKLTESLNHVLKAHGSTLTSGNKYIFQSLPRLLTIWYKFGELSHLWLNGGSGHKPVVSKEKHGQLKQFVDKSHQVVEGLLDRIAPHVWYTGLSQIVSRLCHPCKETFGISERIISRITRAFPHQSTWFLAGVLNASNSDRKQRASSVWKRMNSDFGDTESWRIAAVTNDLVNHLNSICNYKASKVRRLKLSRVFKSVRANFPEGAIVPIQSSLSVSLPSQCSGWDGRLVSSGSAISSLPRDSASGREFSAFPDTLPVITSIDEIIDVLPSKEKPKKLTFIGSDGREYPFLCKKEESGDMRKNSRMMEFITVVNRLLKQNSETRFRKLQLRTFAVIPTTEENGIMEWVPNTAALRRVIEQRQKKEGSFLDFREIMRLFTEHGVGRIPPDRISSREVIAKQLVVHDMMLRRLKPVLQNWFHSKFTEPTLWFENRLLYIHSVAVWSMVGYIVGLGDRHGENILMDDTNGEVVHVDFDCLFNKGETLAQPEMVPFRLTSNLVDAMGITGYEGVFRKTCEVCLSVMRSNAQMLMSVLDTFIHDPLVDWNKAAKANKSKDSKRKSSTRGHANKEEMEKKMHRIELRLRGKEKQESVPLSVQGQVHHLIKEATSSHNLSRMYFGWMPWM